MLFFSRRCPVLVSTTSHPQPCWSTFPELSFNVYKVTGIDIIILWIASKCYTCIHVLIINLNVSFILKDLIPNFRTPSRLWSILVHCTSWLLGLPPSSDIFRIYFLYIWGDYSSFIIFFDWPNLQWNSGQNVNFQATINLLEPVFALFTGDIYRIKKRPTKQNRPIWSQLW